MRSPRAKTVSKWNWRSGVSYTRYARPSRTREAPMDRVTESKVIGVATPRIDGALKVSGGALYSSDHHFEGLLHAMPVCATIGNGAVTKLDTTAAEKMPGVV